MTISILVAMDKNRVIGSGGHLPWKLPSDLKHFRDLTMGHVVIMGRKTYESIGKPLDGRINIIITQQKIENSLTALSLKDALKLAENNNPEKDIFIIGGQRLYQEALDMADKLYMTLIDGDFRGDKYFPNVDLQKWKEISREHKFSDESNNFDMDFVIFNRI